MAGALPSMVEQETNAAMMFIKEEVSGVKEKRELKNASDLFKYGFWAFIVFILKMTDVLPETIVFVIPKKSNFQMTHLANHNKLARNADGQPELKARENINRTKG